LPSLTKVNVVYFVQNKIGKVDEGALDWAKDNLTSLELGGNRIRVSSPPYTPCSWCSRQTIENLEKLTLLEELWLGKNKIRTLEVSLETLYQ
jgi:protein phosphatase 1 regulatory subunit 7